MTDDEILSYVAEELGLLLPQVQDTSKLLDAGNTIPFITRYRKEATGELDEDQVRAISERLADMRALEARRKEILASIQEQGKLTPDLSARISEVVRLQALEDLYLPYHATRRTRGTAAREFGLGPLADEVVRQPDVDGTLDEHCDPYLDPEKGLDTVDKVLQGARDIAAEMVANDSATRKLVRERTMQQGVLRCAARDPAQYSEYQAYYQYSEQLKKVPPHRVLTINRGEKEGYLKVQIEIPVEEMLARMEKPFVKRPSSIFFYQMKDAVRDAYKRLIAPAVEREVRSALTRTAEDEVVQSFSESLKRLLMLPPAKGKRILGVDPGYVSGSRLAVIDEDGKYLAGDTIYPHAPHKRTHHAKKVIRELVQKHKVDLVAIGNGSACRETEQLVADLIPELGREVVYTVVNEAGVSAYADSKAAQAEFPKLDAGTRGTISIARRVLDPLGEWVQVDLRSLGKGLCQHDALPKHLTASLKTVIESSVNCVGVDLNTASVSLLAYVSGITGRTAQSIVRFRNKQGGFKCRAQLLEVDGVDEFACRQAAGFLRVAEGDDPLDSTPIHPESYRAARALLKHLKLDVDSIRGDSALPMRLLLKHVDLGEMAARLRVGMPTLKDILSALECPDWDPRDDLPKPLFRNDVLRIADLKEGMRLRGTVRNVVEFGAFVDIGIKDDALVHISEMSRHYIKSPFDVVSVGDSVEVKVLSIDQKRGRVALSMRA